MINAFQTMDGLRSYARYLQSRLEDMSIANDKLREDLKFAHKQYDTLEVKLKSTYTSPEVPNPYHKIRKLEKENNRLKKSIQKVYLKYIEPQTRKNFDYLYL